MFPTSREKILDVAEARFAQRGYAGVGLREVAEAAGLGKSSLFHHFPTKAALYGAVLDRVIERIDLRMRRALDASPDPREQVSAAVVALIDVLAEDPPAARLLLRTVFEDDDVSPTESPELAAVDARLDGLIARIARAIGEGIACGAFRPISPPDAIQTLIGAVVYPFASGEFGEKLAGDIFSAEAIARRKREVLALIQNGWMRPHSEGEAP
ncbi:MAG TPA: TetR/AcrR family transcriptional regulator [Myxococcota bacterium]